MEKRAFLWALHGPSLHRAVSGSPPPHLVPTLLRSTTSRRRHQGTSLPTCTCSSPSSSSTTATVAAAAATSSLGSRVWCPFAAHRPLPLTLNIARRRLTSSAPHTDTVKSPGVESVNSVEKNPWGPLRGAADVGGSASSATNDTPVSSALLQELRAIISRAPEMKWLEVKDLYAELPAHMRRAYVKPHKSMLHVLQKCHTTLGLSLNATGVYYARGMMPVAPTASPPAPPHGEVQKSEQVAAQEAHPTPPIKATSPVVPAPPDEVSGQHPEAVVSSNGSTIPAVDFYYDVELDKLPPPPPDFNVTSSSLHVGGTQSSADGAVIAVKDFVAHIPPFFVPIRELLTNMPGYTAEHLEVYLKSRAFEMVTVAGERLVRLFGGHGQLSLDGCEVAEAKYERYRPRVELLDEFVAAFQGVHEKWMALPELLRRADPAVVAQLPFQGPVAVAYFAQMQHRFAFAVRHVPAAPRNDSSRSTGSGEGGGAVAEVAEPCQTPPYVAESAVLLRKPGYGGLTAATTPTPKSFNTILRLIPDSTQVDMTVLEPQIPLKDLREVEVFYGDLNGFFAAHKAIFYVPPETPNIVMLTSYRVRLQRAALPLEEQLRIAIEEHNKGRIRSLRRKIAFRDNPSHPLHDPENLAKEVSKYLPRRGFVSLQIFLHRKLPEELLRFMPVRVYNFFNNYPQYFAQFEYQQPGLWCVCRPDQPLPRGVIRQTFTEGDLVCLVAEFLQQRGPRAVSIIHLNLPRGAQDIIRRKYGGVYFFVIRYPQYFNVVIKTDGANKQSGAVVHLVQVPSKELDNEVIALNAASRTNPDAPSAEGAELNLHRPPLSESSDGDGDEDEFDGLD